MTIVVRVATMAAVHVARDRIAREPAEYGTAGHAADISVCDRAANDATANGAQHGAGRMTVTAALVSARHRDSRSQDKKYRSERCRKPGHFSSPTPTVNM